MARFHLISLISGVLFLVTGLSAQNVKPHFKSAEVKHLTLAEGVSLSPDFTNVLYDDLRSELAKTKQFDKVVGEGDAVADADALESVIIDGRITEFKKGRFGSPAEFHIHFTMIGRTSHEVLREIGSGTVWKIANDKESNMANRLAVLLAAFLDPPPLKLTN
jgi:hypothetical protein